MICILNKLHRRRGEMCEMEVKQFTICRRLISPANRSIAARWPRESGKRNGIILHRIASPSGSSRRNPRNFNCCLFCMRNIARILHRPFGETWIDCAMDVTNRQKEKHKIDSIQNRKKRNWKKKLHHKCGRGELWQTHQNGLFCCSPRSLLL